MSDLHDAYQKVRQAIDEYRHLCELAKACDDLILYDTAHDVVDSTSQIHTIWSHIADRIDKQLAIIREFDPDFEGGAE